MRSEILNYKIENVIGSGGMGIIYKARHAGIDRIVAIKEIDPSFLKDIQIRNRFKQEASILAKLDHPNIVRLHEFYEDGDDLFLIMEYVPGMNLGDYIATVSGPIPEERALRIFRKMLSAFKYAHSKDVIHRDVKPFNMMIAANEEVKILDFGIAKLKTSNISYTNTGQKIGTPRYMSPEQVRGEELSQQSDIYCLGVILWQMLTGREPYKEEKSEFNISHKIVYEVLPDPRTVYASISEHLCRVIQLCCEKDLINRFKDINAIENFLLQPPPDKKKFSIPEKRRPAEIIPAPATVRRGATVTTVGCLKQIGKSILILVIIIIAFVIILLIALNNAFK